MRRMLTNKNVVDVVNKAIEEGEIQAGGLPEIHEGDAGKVLTVNAGETAAEWAEIDALPEIQEGDAGKLLAVNSGETGVEWVADNNLKLPGSAPATQQLVGINTSNEQNSLGIGDGLEIDNGVLKYKDEKTLVVDFAGASNLEITDADVQTKLTNKFYDRIVIYHYGSNTSSSMILATLRCPIGINNSGTTVLDSGTAEYFIDNFKRTDMPWNLTASGYQNLSVPHMGGILIAPFTARNGIEWKVNYNTSTHKISVQMIYQDSLSNFRNIIGDEELTTNGGTIPGSLQILPNAGSTIYQKAKGFNSAYVYYCVEGNDKVILKPVQFQQDATVNWQPIVVLKGEHYNTTTGVKDYEYIAILHCNSTQALSSYTLTRTAV